MNRFKLAQHLKSGSTEQLDREIIFLFCRLTECDCNDLQKVINWEQICMYRKVHKTIDFLHYNTKILTCAGMK